ncbi:MAG: hypothetical protein JNK89_01170 [Saprospiraceae bacterium]|nr:hypothetical protein [Saprospiraceae bacterium]
MKRYLHSTLLAAVASLLFTACCKDQPEPPAQSGDPIRFDKLAVGQTSAYLGLLGENYYQNGSDDFSYTDDTLVLTVIAEDGKGFKIAETLRYTGDVDPWMAAEKDSAYFYYLKVENDSLKILPDGTSSVQSRLFDYTVSRAGLPLKNIASPEVTLTGWKTSFPYCECFRTAYAVDYTLFGLKYDRLNVVVDNTFMQVDGPGSTYVFARKYGLVRYSTYSWWTQSGYGWDLLPAE